jgi:hypothetical protein
MSLIRNVNIAAQDSPSIDAFGRWRTSDPFTIFDSKLVSDKAELFYDEITNGTATSSHSTTDSAVTMGVSANNDYAIRQTFMRFNYQPGKSQLVFLTGILGDPVANTVSRIGYFNSNTTTSYDSNKDGLYFEADGTDVSVNQAKSDGTISKITQANWNVDPMDGTGPSGVTADWDSTNIFMFDFEWLGVGRVRCYLVIDGIPCLVHTFNNANSGQTGCYMTSPNHSVRYEIRSTGGTKTMKHICASIQSEGGRDPSGVTRGISVRNTTQNIGTTPEAMIGFRLKSTHLCSIADVVSTALIPTGNEDTQWELQLNPTYADTPTWNSAGTSSPIEYAVGSGANTVSVEGETLAVGYAADDVNNVQEGTNTVIHPGVAIDGTRDEIWLVVRNVGGTGTYAGGLNIREQGCG